MSSAKSLSITRKKHRGKKKPKDIQPTFEDIGENFGEILRWCVVEVVKDGMVKYRLLSQELKRILAPVGYVLDVNEVPKSSKHVVYYIKMETVSQAVAAVNLLRATSKFEVGNNHFIFARRSYWGRLPRDLVWLEQNSASDPFSRIAALRKITTNAAHIESAGVTLDDDSTSRRRVDSLVDRLNKNIFQGDSLPPIVQDAYFRFRRFGEILAIDPCTCEHGEHVTIEYASPISSFMAQESCKDVHIVVNLECPLSDFSLWNQILAGASELCSYSSAASDSNKEGIPKRTRTCKREDSAREEEEEVLEQGTKNSSDSATGITHKRAHADASPKLHALSSGTQTELPPAKTFETPDSVNAPSVTDQVDVASSQVSNVEPARSDSEAGVGKREETCQGSEFHEDESDLGGITTSPDAGSNEAVVEIVPEGDTPGAIHSCELDQPRAHAIIEIACPIETDVRDVARLLEDLNCSMDVDHAVDEGYVFVSFDNMDTLEIATGLLSSSGINYSVVKSMVPGPSQAFIAPGNLSIEEAREQAELQLVLEMQVAKEMSAIQQQNHADKLADSFKKTVRMASSSQQEGEMKGAQPHGYNFNMGYAPAAMHAYPNSYYPHYPMPMWAPVYPMRCDAPMQMVPQPYMYPGMPGVIPPMIEGGDHGKMDFSDGSAPLETSRLYVTFGRPLPEDLLRSKFEEAAPGLEYVSRHKDKCFAFVKYSTESGAKLAMMRLNGKEIQGYPLTISIAEPPKTPSSRKRQRVSDAESQQAGKKV